jgi:hypothetical protein
VRSHAPERYHSRLFQHRHGGAPVPSGRSSAGERLHDKVSPMAAEPARRHASYEDVLQSADSVVAEVLDGDLYTSPRPAAPHAEAVSVLGMDVGAAFREAVEVRADGSSSSSLSYTWRELFSCRTWPAGCVRDFQQCQRPHSSSYRPTGRAKSFRRAANVSFASASCPSTPGNACPTSGWSNLSQPSRSSSTRCGQHRRPNQGLCPASRLHRSLKPELQEWLKTDRWS